MLTSISYTLILHSSVVLGFIALMGVFCYKAYALKIMSDMPLKEPCPSEKEKPEKQSIARELRKRKTRLQNRARRLTKRIRDSAFPPNTIDYMWDMYEKRGVSFNAADM